MKRKNIAEELIQAMREAVAVAEGKLQPAKVHRIPIPPKPTAPSPSPSRKPLATQ
ncbi:MAG TPA: hypothetical protein VKB38_18110 [Terracidiphilus sp.]|nr:hypothetical protein [Terracidiphilus sp.]